MSDTLLQSSHQGLCIDIKILLISGADFEARFWEFKKKGFLNYNGKQFRYVASVRDLVFMRSGNVVHTLGVVLIFPSMVCYTFGERGAHSGSDAYYPSMVRHYVLGTNVGVPGTQGCIGWTFQDGLLEASVVEENHASCHLH
ncbi:hypothetical protein RIF29_20699 [Crotalaria pallida]|uniref:Uncharacterized protein n=1 Tax=Crotalaria pallida TaxID=3830 RepID=A0AAN9F201_CROPI